MVSNYRSKSMEERKNFPPLWLVCTTSWLQLLPKIMWHERDSSSKWRTPTPIAPVQCWLYGFKFLFFFSAQSKLLSREGDIRNRLLQKHSQALRRSRIRINFAKCVSAPIFLKGTKGVFNSCSLVISIYSCKFVILINYLLILTNWCNKRFSMPRGVF